MAWEYVAPDQIVALNAPVLFNASVPCTCGRVYHNDGEGTFQLKGINRGGCGCGCGCQKTTDYKVEFTGNIAVPTGGTVGPIALAIAINGEPVNYSRGIFTPTAVDVYGNVKAEKVISIPWNCCPTASVEYVNGSVDDPAFVPTPVIRVVDGNINITPVNE